MASQGKGTGVVGYNVQTAVDAEHHLIVTHEVTNIGTDRDQLYPMAEKAREAMGTEDLTAVADRGYYKSEQILACHEAGGPRPRPTRRRGAGPSWPSLHADLEAASEKNQPA